MKIKDIVKFEEATKKVIDGIEYILYGCDSCGGGYIKAETSVYVCPICGSNHIHGYTREV